MGVGGWSLACIQRGAGGWLLACIQRGVGGHSPAYRGGGGGGWFNARVRAAYRAGPD